jgi:hypothetical protein
MTALAIAAIVLACVFGGAVAGLSLRGYLPPHHLNDRSKDTVKAALGVIATMAALVLGLLVSSAKSSFDRMSDELTQAAATVVQLDRALASYGAESSEVRRAVRVNYQQVVDILVAQDTDQLTRLKTPTAGSRVEDVAAGIRALAPRSDEQRDLRTKALALVEVASANRWLLLLQQHGSISPPLLIVVVTWLTLIFFGFGVLAPPRNATVVTALFLCALSVAGAIFIILEMDEPLGGLVRVSEVPMRTGLAILGKD